MVIVLQGLQAFTPHYVRLDRLHLCGELMDRISEQNKNKIKYVYLFINYTDLSNFVHRVLWKLIKDY